MASGQAPAAPSGRPRRRLLVAVLLDGPVADEVTGLRRAVTGHEGHLAPHVTVVPPVNLPEAAVADALGVVRAAAGAAWPLRVELGPPAMFDRGDRAVLYLAVGGDTTGLSGLRQAASRPPLAAPESRAERPFVPHVTLGRMAPGRATRLVEDLAAYRSSATCTRVQLLAEVAGPDGRRWEVVAAEVLGGRAVRQRGGLEVAVHLADRLDPEAAAVLSAALAAEAPSGGPDGDVLSDGEPFVFVARRHGAVVGGASGRVLGGVAVCRWLLVVPAERGTGAGSRLVEAVERYAGERGLAAVRHVVPAGGGAGGLLRRRGYAPVGTVAGAAGGWDVEVLERRRSPVD